MSGPRSLPKIGVGPDSPERPRTATFSSTIGRGSPKPKAPLTSLSMDSANPLGGGDATALTNKPTMFDFDASSLSSFALPKTASGANGKKPGHGRFPPTSGTAALQRSPDTVYQDTARAMATSKQEADPGSPTPARPKTALQKVLIESGGWSGGEGGARRLAHLPVPPCGLAHASPYSRGGNNNSSGSEGDDEYGGNTSPGRYAQLSPKSAKSASSNLEAFLNIDDKVGQEEANTCFKEHGSPELQHTLCDRSGFFTNFVLMSELLTANDSVDYFLKKQSHKFPVKFLHMVPKNPGYNGYFPYEFDVVTQAVAEATHTHAVMTESGVTVLTREGSPAPLVGPQNGATTPTPGQSPPKPTDAGLAPLLLLAGSSGGQSAAAAASSVESGVDRDVGKFGESETTPLGQWVSERNIYRIISERLGFFHQYLPRKVFGMWRENVRFKQFARSRRQSTQKLSWFGSHALATVCGAMALNSWEMKHVPLMQWEHPVKKKDFTLKAFAETQASEKTSAEKSLDAQSKAIADAFGDAALALERRRLPPDQQHPGGDGGSQPAASSPLLSLLSAKQQQAAGTQSIVGLRLQNEAAARREKEYSAMVATLPRLGRLGQYVVFESLMEAADRTAQDGLRSILTERRGVALFEVHVSFARSAVLEAEERADKQAREEAAAGEGADGAGAAADAVSAAETEAKTAAAAKAAAAKEGAEKGKGGVSRNQRKSLSKDARKGSVRMTADEEAAEEEAEEAHALAVRLAEDAKHRREVSLELVFSPTVQELRGAVEAALHECVDLLAMQSARELGLPKAVEKDFNYATSRAEIFHALGTHFELGTQLALEYFGEVHRVWEFERTWTLGKFSEQGENLDTDTCHAEIAFFKKCLQTLEDMRDKCVAGCITVHALALKGDLAPRIEAKLKSLSAFTEEAEREITGLKHELEVDKAKFEALLAKYEEHLGKAMALDDYERWDKSSAFVLELFDNLEQARATVQDFNAREKRFKVPHSEWPLINDVGQRLDPFYRVWHMVRSFNQGKQQWLTGPLLDVDAPAAENDVMDWYKKSAKLAKLVEKDHPHLASCASKLREDTGEFRQYLPIMVALATPALKQPVGAGPHWEKVSALMNVPPIEPGEALTLEGLVEAGVTEFVEGIEEISMHATKQYGLEKNLKAMRAEWEFLAGEIRDYKNTGTCIVGGLDDIIALLDEHIVKTQTMRGSPFAKGIMKECVGWEEQLKYAQSMLDEWVKVQRTWMYLEPIFASEDIMRQLPSEAKRFAEVNASWRSIQAEAKACGGHFLTMADRTKRYEHTFKVANTKLDEVQKGLADYLEVKRMYFPRFFFLSNDELLEIISQTKDPTAVQQHLNKAFEGISKVKFEKDLKITDMRAAKGEIVVLDEPIDPESPENKGNVECWLLLLERMQWRTLKTATDLGLKDYKAMPRDQWTLRWPQQVILAGSSVYWTNEVNAALNSGGCKALREYVDTVLNPQLLQIVDLVRGKLNKVQMSTLGALVVIDVHARDTCDVMVDAKVDSVSAFEWVSQLRYTWDPSWKKGQAVEVGDDTLVCRIVNAKALYGYEYLGNSMRLVITPLTDRCYRTMIGAIELLYGGAPEGPAGTGKTETVKDLSKAVAIHCVVFNCSDSMDFRQMAKFFKGLAGCGSWCCFDEFNRINVEVLSVIAQQLLTINGAKKQGVDMFHFEGSYMKINNNCNAYITMNPGYAGRTELPDNLKALFRPCAMMVPDYALISEIRLYSFGFGEPRGVAQKLVKVLQLSSEQLSSQKHYDYGMRAVQSILVACGNMFDKVGKDPAWTEAKIVLRSVYDVNLPKFTVEDLPLFRGITSDLFPGVELPIADHGPLLACIDEQCRLGVKVANGREPKLDPVDSYTNKIRELYEMVLVRHGVMVCGTTGSGKTSGIHCLKQALTVVNERGHDKQFPKVKCYTMNPKSIKSSQLYGNFDENTHEWSDGILPVLYRAAARDPTSDRNWVIFDGPVDAVWIENMNTVLDDNKKLCLNSGEIIKMSDEMTMMFEAEDLEQASPATISRVGMVFCETRNVGWRPLRNVWLWGLDEHQGKPAFLDGVFKDHIALFEELFEWLFLPAMYFAHNKCRIPTPVTDMEMIASMLRLLTCLLTPPPGEELNWDLPKVAECCFVKALVWSVGGAVAGESRGPFNDYLKALCIGQSEAHPAHPDFLNKNRSYDQATFSSRIAGLLPEFSHGGHEVTLFDVRFDPVKCQWLPWVGDDFEFSIPPSASYNSVVVPTVDTIRNDYLMDQLLCYGYHVLCTGDTGTGKSVSVKKKLLEGMSDKFTSMFLNFSAQTGANQTQDIIDSKLDKRRKGVIGPPVGKKCVIMVDDLNMPAKETYGAQPPIEILRQWMDHAGWYDREETVYRELVDIQFIAAMGPPGGGRTFITQRYVRHFNVLNFVPFSDKSLTRVFVTIVDWFLDKGKFNPEVSSTSEPMVKGTIDVYNTIALNLLPTPSKSHYLFNLRDISKVFQGVSQGSATMITDKVGMVRLWSHECLRVFADRLTNPGDRDWFSGMLAERVSSWFDGVDFKKEVCLEEEAPAAAGAAVAEKPLLFGNYMEPGAVTLVYQHVADHAKLNSHMSDYLDEYNSMTKKPMSLVLFGNALEHVSRISRVINQPYGNALLVGVGGSGRKSLTTLAVSIADFKLFQIEISKSYGTNEWREDMKLIMSMAGEKDQATVFLFDDTQIVNEGFLEDVNGILNTGEVANLFNGEELMAIFATIEKAAAAVGINTGNQNDMYAYFVRRCRENLHVVLCMSPIGDAFRTRLRFFPALVNCCTIDWFTEWPEEALRTVAGHFLNTLDMEDQTRSGLVDVCVQMQEMVTAMSLRYRSEMGRYYYVTPTSYLELISTFKGLLNSQRQEVLDAKLRYDNGLEKIYDTQEQVDVMKKELIDLQPKLKEATISTDALIVQIDKDTIEANEKKKVVQGDEKVCKQQAAEANAIKSSCEADLAEALPALDGALKALKSLSKGDIVEVKAMGKPPGGVKLTMEACCIMFGVSAEKVKDPESGKKVDDYWGPAKKHLLGDPKFLDNLSNYDKDHMDPDMVKKVAIFCAREDFTPEAVKKGSVAAAGVCKWVHAMVLYDRVAKNVAPKKAALKEASDSLASSTKMLAEKQAVLKEVLDKLQVLQDGLDEAQAKKEALANQVDDCSKKLVRAEQLISGLGGERDRWQEFSASLATKYENVTGDIMLSAGVVAYLGSFVSSYREAALQKWAENLQKSGIMCSSPFSLQETLGKAVTIRSWVIDKLPNDSVSIENAIMLERSNRWPLMIDPQGQANRWVKNTEARTGLKVVKQTMANFVRVIEAALQYGNPVLLENVAESIDPVLEPVLLKQIVVVGGAATIKLGDATVDYDPKFKLYITTKMRNPHYPPELCVKVNLLNFMATADGLEDQMQGIVVAKEEAALEALRERLVLEDAESKATLQEIEDQILSLLQNAEGNILDDEVLINTLAESKKTSVVIEQKVAEASKTQVVIAETRKGYKRVAKHASILFFCIADLSIIDPMYQYSLDWFIGLFNLSIDNTEQPPDLSLEGDGKLQARMTLLNDTFTYTLYLNICRSLFEKDKLLFSCLLTTKIMLGGGKLRQPHLRFLLTGATAVDLPQPNPFPAWLSDKAWGDLLEIDDVPGFEGLIEKIFLPQPAKWQAVLESNSPAKDIAELAKPVTEDPFGLLCVVRSVRPDVLVPEIQSYVANELGPKFIEPPPLELQSCYADSTAVTPLLFVLTPGADPMTTLLMLAQELNKYKTMTAISLGQGQGPKAEAKITEALELGYWVCLQNCHLSVSWLPTLERICEEFNPDTSHKDFRLWLTSEPSGAFPAFILQNSIKMTVEPPKGMRASLNGSWSKIQADWYESSSNPPVFKKLLFGLTFLHATVIERRKFGPLGWNVKYVFSGPDMSICMDQLKIFLEELPQGGDVPYAALAYLAGECNYGGRCTDDKDRRCLVNIISEFYHEKLLDDTHKFSPSGTYFAPPQGTLGQTQDYVKTLPYTEGPEVFGLHGNANISCALSETNELLNTMQSLQPQTGGGAGKSWDETLLELARDIQGKIPEQYDVEVALLDFPVLYEECMNTVLVQELIRFNRVIKVVSSSLSEVQRAVKGLVVMSGELEAMGNSMVITKVPAMWGFVSYPSLKGLGAWVKDFLERLDFLRDWFEAKKPPSRYWVSGFFFTQAFITGTLQNFARQFKIPIDQTDFDFKVLTPKEEEGALTKGPDTGAFLHGLFMEGARWNAEAHHIDESLPRVLFVSMPHFHLWPRAKADIPAIEGRIELYTGSPTGTAHVYNCPVYKTSERRGVLLTTGHSTNFVMWMRIGMHAKHEQIHWVKRGVAMLTGLDD